VINEEAGDVCGSKFGVSINRGLIWVPIICWWICV